MSSQPVDIKILMAEIRQRAKAEMVKGAEFVPAYQPPAPVGGVGKGAPLVEQDELKYLNSHWHDWCVTEEITSHRRFFGPLIVRFKRFVLDIVRNNLLRGYFERERQFQMQLVRQLNTMAKHVDARDYEIFWGLTKKVDADVEAMNIRADQLFDGVLSELRGQVAELDSRLDILEEKIRSRNGN